MKNESERRAKISRTMTGKKLPPRHRKNISLGMKYSKRVGIYPWQAWFAKVRFVLRHGRDFEIAVSSMKRAIRNRAHREGRFVSIKALTDRAFEVVVR
jgi:hypothetical protein